MGRATAIEMARSGVRIALFGRRREPIEDCAKAIRQLGGEALAIQGDIRAPDQIDAAMNAIAAGFGGLDILVNNAGGQFIAPAREISNKGFEAVVRNNLIGSWQVTKAAADHFMFERGGKVIFVTACVRSGLAGFAHTAAARGGVTAMMKTLAFEWAQYGILLNCVAPGTIRTEALGRYPIPPAEWNRYNRNLLGRTGRPEDVAGAIIFLASPLGDFITGEDWYIDGGETLHFAHDAREMIDHAKFDARKRGAPAKS
jgi:citronellol/citronellal dehydrogenase